MLSRVKKEDLTSFMDTSKASSEQPILSGKIIEDSRLSSERDPAYIGYETRQME